ncbi:hypothetical protein Golob_021891, partial [Gossypium lobatum]|nr:hypothetical protein [Gossypium lobatum]
MTNHEFMSTRSSKISRYLMLHGPRRMTGSDGGLTEPAFEFIKQSDGLTTENNYPYEVLVLK